MLQESIRALGILHVRTEFLQAKIFSLKVGNSIGRTVIMKHSIGCANIRDRKFLQLKKVMRHATDAYVVFHQ